MATYHCKTGSERDREGERGGREGDKEEVREERKERRKDVWKKGREDGREREKKVRGREGRKEGCEAEVGGKKERKSAEKGDGESTAACMCFIMPTLQTNKLPIPIRFQNLIPL